jgi:hypothetical protein
VLHVVSLVPAAVCAWSHALLMLASPMAAQHAARSAHVLPVVPLVPLVPLVPPLLVRHAGFVQVCPQVAEPSMQAEHAAVGCAHLVIQAVSLHAHAWTHVMYGPHGPLNVPLFQPAP